jgi:PhnB protein
MNQTKIHMEKAQKKTVSAVPEGFHTVTPFIMADNAEKLIAFIEDAFGGKLTFKMKGDDNKIMHATVTIGNSVIMLGDTMDNMPAQTAMLYLYLEDVDAAYNRAIKAKGVSIHEPTNEFYGDRAAAVKDEFGNVWWMATHVEDVDQNELEKRAKKATQERKEKGHEVHA